MDVAELATRLAAVDASKGRLVSTVAGLDEADLGGPSLCPGWTRGHVIAHVALNAHSIVNLMTWAQTGQEVPQYVGRKDRDADIEMFSSRTTVHGAAAMELRVQALWDVTVCQRCLELTTTGDTRPGVLRLMTQLGSAITPGGSPWIFEYSRGDP